MRISAPSLCLRNSKTFPLEAPAQQRPNLRFVIDDQDVLVAAAP
jgi:hypothetical protein